MQIFFWAIFLFAFHQPSKLVLQKSVKMTFSRVKALMRPDKICFGILPVCENSGLVQDFGVVLREREEGGFFSDEGH